MSECVVTVRVSRGRKKLLEELVADGQFRSMAEVINTALTLLFDQYGKLGIEKSVIPQKQEEE